MPQEIEPASYTCQWARRLYAGMTTAQAARSCSKTCSLLLHLRGLLGLLMRRVKWLGLGRRSARNGRVGWCLRTRFSARDWRDSGDKQDSNAATATGAGDGVRREPRHASLALAHVPLQIFRHFSISCHIHPDRVSASRAFRFLYGFVCRTGFIICRVAQSSRCSVSGVLLGYEVLYSYYRRWRFRE
jgi:hypothetical protein